MVGVGHAHFSLYLGSPQSGVDISWALSLLCLPQFREPTPHVPVEGEIKERKEKKVKQKTTLTFERDANTHIRTALHHRLGSLRR